MPGPARRACHPTSWDHYLFDDLRARWADVLEEDRLRALGADLHTVTPPDLFRLDAPGWFGGYRP
jgi:hypothetical protein